MATGKPPWNHFSQEVSAIFHIASAREPPKPPVWLSVQAQDFAKQCLRLYVAMAMLPRTRSMPLRWPNRAVACSGLPRRAYRVPTERPTVEDLQAHPFLMEPDQEDNAPAPAGAKADAEAETPVTASEAGSPEPRTEPTEPPKAKPESEATPALPAATSAAAAAAATSAATAAAPDGGAVAPPPTVLVHAGSTSGSSAGTLPRRLGTSTPVEAGSLSAVASSDSLYSQRATTEALTASAVAMVMAAAGVQVAGVGSPAASAVGQRAKVRLRAGSNASSTSSAATAAAEGSPTTAVPSRRQGLGSGHSAAPSTSSNEGGSPATETPSPGGSAWSGQSSTGPLGSRRRRPVPLPDALIIAPATTAPPAGTAAGAPALTKGTTHGGNTSTSTTASGSPVIAGSPGIPPVGSLRRRTSLLATIVEEGPASLIPLGPTSSAPSMMAMTSSATTSDAAVAAAAAATAAAVTVAAATAAAAASAAAAAAAAAAADVTAAGLAAAADEAPAGSTPAAARTKPERPADASASSSKAGVPSLNVPPVPTAPVLSTVPVSTATIGRRRQAKKHSVDTSECSDVAGSVDGSPVTSPPPSSHASASGGLAHSALRAVASEDGSIAVPSPVETSAAAAALLVAASLGQPAPGADGAPGSARARKGTKKSGRAPRAAGSASETADARAAASSAKSPTKRRSGSKVPMSVTPPPGTTVGKTPPSQLIRRHTASELELPPNIGSSRSSPSTTRKPAAGTGKVSAAAAAAATVAAADDAGPAPTRSASYGVLPASAKTGVDSVSTSMGTLSSSNNSLNSAASDSTLTPRPGRRKKRLAGAVGSDPTTAAPPSVAPTSPMPTEESPSKGKSASRARRKRSSSDIPSGSPQVGALLE